MSSCHGMPGLALGEWSPRLRASGEAQLRVIINYPVRWDTCGPGHPATGARSGVHVAASPLLLRHCALCVWASFSGRIQSSSSFRTHTASQGRKRPLPGTVPRGPPHISQGLPQPLAAPGAGAGPARLFLEWAVGSGSWREGGCSADLASSLSPPPQHPPPRWENRGSGGAGWRCSGCRSWRVEGHDATGTRPALMSWGSSQGSSSPFSGFHPCVSGSPQLPMFS